MYTRRERDIFFLQQTLNDTRKSRLHIHINKRAKRGIPFRIRDRPYRARSLRSTILTYLRRQHTKQLPPPSLWYRWPSLAKDLSTVDPYSLWKSISQTLTSPRKYVRTGHSKRTHTATPSRQQRNHRRSRNIYPNPARDIAVTSTACTTNPFRKTLPAAIPTRHEQKASFTPDTSGPPVRNHRKGQGYFGRQSTLYYIADDRGGGFVLAGGKWRSSWHT